MYSIIKKSQFIKNITLLLSGNIFGQLIPIIASVILTRLYSPDDFAVLAYFLIITSIISVIAGGRYELAIMLPEDEKKAKTLYVISLIFNVSISGIVALVCYLFGSGFAALFNAEILIGYLYLIPFSIFFVGLYQSANNYANRLSKYKLMSSTVICRSVFTSGSNIALGFAGFTNIGLIIGTLVGQFIGALILSINIIKELISDFPSTSMIKSTIIEYKDFPLKNGISMFFNLLANQIPILLIGYFFQNNTIVGWYALVLRVLNLPLMTIGKSVSQVFYQETNQSEKNNQLNLFIKTSKGLFVLIIIPAIILLFAGPFLFKFIFGAEWEDAGIIAQIFILFYIVRFVFSSQSTLLISNKKLKTELLFNVVFFISQISCVILGYKMGNYFYSFIFMSVAGFIQFSILGLILYNSSKLINDKKNN